MLNDIENAKNYLNESASKKLQAIIKDNTGKEIKYGTPKGCDTGILKDSENFFFTTVPPPYQKYQLLHRLTPPSVWRVFGLVCFV
jgi:hypothetical protein